MICFTGLPILDSSYIDSPDTSFSPRVSSQRLQGQEPLCLTTALTESTTRGQDHPIQIPICPTSHFIFLSMILFISEIFKRTKKYRTGDAAQLAEGLRSIHEA